MIVANHIAGKRITITHMVAKSKLLAILDNSTRTDTESVEPMLMPTRALKFIQEMCLQIPMSDKNSQLFQFNFLEFVDTMTPMLIPI
jgi:hypothetical protein